MNIKTEYVNPPIPDRRWDWRAWIEGEEDGLELLLVFVVRRMASHSYC